MLNSITLLITFLRFIVLRRVVVNSGLFDSNWYRLANPDIVPKRIDPLTHFLKYGRKHRLAPSRAFDASRYLEQHSEASSTQLNPLVHYIKYGRALGLEIHTAPPSAADRIAASGLFDEQWYLSNHPDVASAGIPALLHYLLHGALEGRAPGPNFDAQWYFSRYPDILGMNPLLHFIDHGHREGRAHQRPSTHIFEIIQETVRGVEDLEPSLYTASYLHNLANIPVVDGRARHRAARCLEVIVENIATAPRAIVLLPWLIHGGADLVACHAIRALSEKYGPESVLAILTDTHRIEAAHLLPAGVPTISLSRFDDRLSHSERAELIDLLTRAAQPDVLLNVNSHAGWEAIKYYGARLSKFTQLYAMLFCPDFSAEGRRAGYSDMYLRECLPYISSIYFDNQRYIDELIKQFSIPENLCARLITLYQPAPQIERIKRERQEGKPLQVLWASRLVFQKNLDLLIKIVENAPLFEFHIWGKGEQDLQNRMQLLERSCPHVKFHGPFERFEALPLGEYDALLYTSRWDGLPNVLLEASSAELPIVASDVGGISELVNWETGWLITDVNSPFPYINALHSISNEPMTVARRNSKMLKRLAQNHTWDRYRSTLQYQPTQSMGMLNIPSKQPYEQLGFGSTNKAEICSSYGSVALTNPAAL